MNNMTRKRCGNVLLRLFAFAVFMAGVAGCNAVEYRSRLSDWMNVTLNGGHSLPPFNLTRSRDMDGQSVRKILVVPFSLDSRPEKIAVELTQTFLQELDKIGRFQILHLPYESAELSESEKILLDVSRESLWDSGVVDVELLINARKKFGAHAIVFGKITEYNPNAPLTLDLQITMISSRSGAVLWSVDGSFASDQEEIVPLAKKYYRKYYREERSLYGWELMLVSMDRYSRFILNMLISTIEGG